MKKKTKQQHRVCGAELRLLLPCRSSFLDLERVKALSRRDEWVSEKTEKYISRSSFSLDVASSSFSAADGRVCGGALDGGRCPNVPDIEASI